MRTSNHLECRHGQPAVFGNPIGLIIWVWMEGRCSRTAHTNSRLASKQCRCKEFLQFFSKFLRIDDPNISQPDGQPLSTAFVGASGRISAVWAAERKNHAQKVVNQFRRQEIACPM